MPFIQLNPLPPKQTNKQTKKITLFWGNMQCQALGINMARWSYHWKDENVPTSTGWNIFIRAKTESTLFVLCREQDHVGMQLPLSGSINMPYIMISWLNGWYICVCVCVSAPQQGPKAMFWLVEVRDTEGLSLPFFPTVPIYTNKIQQDKYGNNMRKHSRHLWHKLIQVSTLLVRGHFHVRGFPSGFLFFCFFQATKQPPTPRLHRNLEITSMWQMGWAVTLGPIRPARTSLSDPCAWLHQLIAARPGAIWNSKLVSVSANAVCVFVHCVPGTLRLHININWHFNLDGK